MDLVALILCFTTKIILLKLTPKIGNKFPGIPKIKTELKFLNVNFKFLNSKIGLKLKLISLKLECPRSTVSGMKVEFLIIW